jgi:hypothetical protein
MAQKLNKDVGKHHDSIDEEARTTNDESDSDGSSAFPGLPKIHRQPDNRTLYMF